MAALGHWAARQGARYAYVQVATVNEPAIGAYTTLGFVLITDTAISLPHSEVSRSWVSCR